MDRIYKIGGHCFALPDERLMEAVDGISGFKPFVWQPDLVSVKDVYVEDWKHPAEDLHGVDGESY